MSKDCTLVDTWRLADETKLKADAIGFLDSQWAHSAADGRNKTSRGPTQQSRPQAFRYLSASHEPKIENHGRRGES